MDNVGIASAAFIILWNALRPQKKRKRRRLWMTKILRSREIYSGSNLLNDLLLEDTGQFKNFCRISSADFEFLINAIGPKVAKKNTNYRSCIPVNERLAVTLRFLATGDSFVSLMYLFKISKQSISNIIVEVCEALIEVLKENVKVNCFPNILFFIF